MYTVAYVLRVAPTSIYTLPKVEIAVRKPKSSTWDSMERNSDPVKRINIKKVRNRFAKVDWLNESQFNGKTYEDFLAGSHSGIGFFAVTLTIDYSKSKWAEDGVVDFRKLFRSHDQNLTRDKQNRPAYAWQVDLDDNNRPHLHQVFLCRTPGEAETLRKHLAWWERNHGAIDYEPLASSVDLAKWVNYMFKPRPWHDTVPAGVFDKVDIYRDLGKVSSSGVPQILQMGLEAVEVTEDAKAPELPPAVMCEDSYEHKLDLSKAKDVGDPGSVNDMVGGPWLKNFRGRAHKMSPMQVFSTMLFYAHKNLYQAGALALVRLAHRAVVSAFFKVWVEGGRQRAISYLVNRLSGEASNFAWRAVEALRESGITCGVRLVTTAGERIHINNDSSSLFGMQMRSPEEISELVDARLQEVV